MNFWAFNRVPVLTVVGEKSLKSLACLFDTDLEAAAMLNFSDNSLFPPNTEPYAKAYFCHYGKRRTANG